MSFPVSDLYRTVQVYGCTCWTGGDDVCHPRGEVPYLNHFAFPCD